MRIIGMLIALAVVGWLVMQQLGPANGDAENAGGAGTGAGGAEPPKVPGRAAEVPRFEDDMNQFMDAAAQQRAEELEAQTR